MNTSAQPTDKEQGVRGMAAVSVGLGLLALGIFMLLSFLTGDGGMDPADAAERCLTGIVGAYAAFGVFHTVGSTPALVLGVMVCLWGLHVVRTSRFFATWPHLVGGVMILLGTSIGSCASADSYTVEQGGLLAMYVAPPALLYFGRWGLIIAASALIVLGILLAYGESAIYLVHGIISTAGSIVGSLAASLSNVKNLAAQLFLPRLAAAAAGVAQKRKEPEPAAPAPEMHRTATADEEEKKEFCRQWAPRSEFVSRFMSFDFTKGNTVADPEPMEKQDCSDEIPQESLEDIRARGGWPRDLETPAVAVAPAAEPAPVAAPVPVAETAPMPAAALATAEESASSVASVSIDAPAAAVESSSIVDLEAILEAPVAPRPVAPAPAARPRERYTPRVEKPAAAPAPQPARDMDQESSHEHDAKDALALYELPGLEMLDEPQPPVVEDDTVIEGRAHTLEQTLKEFKIAGQVVNVERGPRVTMYEISLAPGIRLSKVTTLTNNIAMKLKAESIRIIAPIPGRDTIGIEIPNTIKELVSLREIVGAVNREKRRQALPVCLGKDVSGQALVADLARMPHLLIAGATGSGKSVCINSIIMSLLMCCRPDEAQLILVDPKVVELSRFKDIPHLMSPVITDMKRAVSVLEWVCQKMDERYEQMSQVSVNNIAKFNALGEEGIRQKLDMFSSDEEIEAFPKKMPYMVVIIDELADLMMVAGKEVEQHITRLAAKSRAVGIHLILATQRPSVDVITGLIKANMPSRIAFQVASKVDSRTILDQNGAETLLGQGDMLYLPPGVGKLTRAQGVFVSDEELFRVVDACKAQAAPQYHADLLGPVIGAAPGAVDTSQFDELFLVSGEAIIESQRGSVSLLQRKFGIGYGRASRIIDQLASVGLLGPFKEGKAREILMDMGAFHARFGASDQYGAGSLAGLREDEMAPAGAGWED